MILNKRKNVHRKTFTFIKTGRSHLVKDWMSRPPVLVESSKRWQVSGGHNSHLPPVPPVQWPPKPPFWLFWDFLPNILKKGQPLRGRFSVLHPRTIFDRGWPNHPLLGSSRCHSAINDVRRRARVCKWRWSWRGRCTARCYQTDLSTPTSILYHVI